METGFARVFHGVKSENDENLKRESIKNDAKSC
jgi:hypothetical protein